jgi:hypothetical protein
MPESIPALTRQHRKLLRRRRRALLREHFSLAKRLGIAARKLAQQITRLRKRQVGEFKPFMLDGHPGNVTNAVKRVIGHAYDNFGLRVSATTDYTHSPTSWHYPSSPQNDGKHGAAVDLYGTTANMVKFQRRQRTRPSYWNELFGPDDFYVKNGAVVDGAFPDHGDHDHAAPTESYR